MNHQKLKVTLFGHFGRANFGNESTLQAMLYHLRLLVPDVELNCICTGPENVATVYNINAMSNRNVVASPLVQHGRAVRFAQKLFIGVPIELHRWLRSFKTLWGTDALIIPGTGLLTDAYTLFNWGPYDMFRWSVAAKLCGCKLLFVSVGAGPLYSGMGRFFVKTALFLADFRSYRDPSTQQYLKSIGLRVENDPVYPDLAFSLPISAMRERRTSNGRRPVVGLGLMEYAGKYSVESPTDATPLAYMESLVAFASWLLDHGYDVRLLIGAMADVDVTREFLSRMKQSAGDLGGRIINEPVESAGDLMSQLAATDFVVATRFHNVLLSLLLNKPTVAISFHHKCSSLMRQMGLAEYCQDINSLTGAKVIASFSRLRLNANYLKHLISEKVAHCQDALDQQYRVMLTEILRGGQLNVGVAGQRCFSSSDTHSVEPEATIEVPTTNGSCGGS